MYIFIGELHLAEIGAKFSLSILNGFFMAAFDIINDGHWNDVVEYDFTGTYIHAYL